MLRHEPITPAPTNARVHRRPILRVALVGDHEITYHGLAALLSPFDDVGLQHCPHAAAVQGEPDVALCDTAIDPHAPDEIVGHPRIRTVALFETRPDPARTRRALASGVHGVLTKSMGAGDLHRCLRRLVAGERVVVGLDGAERPGSGATAGREAALSRRESQVLREIVAGHSNECIATHLYITINTLKSTIRAAYRKMGVSTRAQAVLWGIQHGYTPRAASDQEPPGPGAPARLRPCGAHLHAGSPPRPAVGGNNPGHPPFHLPAVTGAETR